MALADQKLEVIAEVAKVELYLIQQANIAGISTTDLATITTTLNAEINAAVDFDALDALNLGIQEPVAFANTLARYAQEGASNDVVLGGGSGNVIQRGGTAASPYTPKLVGNISLLDAIWVKVIGAYAFTINTGVDGLRIINVSDTANPVVVSTLAFGSFLQDADVVGRFLYVIDGALGSETLFVVDVSNVASPVLRGTLGLGQNPTSITVSGKYLYITEETAGVLKIVDVTDPDNPFLVNSVAVPTGFPQATIVSDGFAYVSGAGTTDFNILDVTDPLTASAVGSLILGSFAPHIDVSGKHVFLVDQNPTPTRVHVIDVSDPSNPAVVGAAELDVPSNALAVKMSGNYLYVTDEAQFELWVFNIADKTAPVEIGRFPFGVPSFPNGIDIVGNHVYVADGFSDTLKIIDISGINVQAAVVHVLQAFTAQVMEDLRVGKDLHVRNGFNVGGHALFDGDLGIGGNLRVGRSNITASFPSPEWAADMLDSPNNADWAINAMAGIKADTNNAGLVVRTFDDTVEEGVGFEFVVPATAFDLKLRWQVRAETTPGGAVVARWNLRFRGFPDNGAVEAWSAPIQLTDSDFGTNEFFQYDEDERTLVAWGLTAGRKYQFELTRDATDGADTLVGDASLCMLQMGFS